MALAFRPWFLLGGIARDHPAVLRDSIDVCASAASSYTPRKLLRAATRAAVASRGAEGAHAHPVSAVREPTAVRRRDGACGADGAADAVQRAASPAVCRTAAASSWWLLSAKADMMLLNPSQLNFGIKFSRNFEKFRVK